MKRTWIHHAIIVNEGRRFAGSVVIEGEKIQEIIEASSTINKVFVARLSFIEKLLVSLENDCCRYIFL